MLDKSLKYILIKGEIDNINIKVIDLESQIEGGSSGLVEGFSPCGQVRWWSLLADDVDSV